MNLGHYVRLLRTTLSELDIGCRAVAAAHGDEPDVQIDCTKFAQRCADQARLLSPFLDRYATDAGDDGGMHDGRPFRGPRDGPLGLLGDLHDLYVMCCDCDLSWTMVAQGAHGARDAPLLDVVRDGQPHVAVQVAWIRSRMRQAAPQVLVVVR